jgi:multiple sugar transport system substrate-binding protein
MTLGTTWNPTRRTVLKGAGAIAAAGAVGLPAPAVIGQARPFDGVTINGASFSYIFFEHLQKYLPEFEQRTGMTVNLSTQAFPVYNQRTDLELSTGGSAFDFITITFIYAGRWIGAGWMTDLEPFLDDPNLTPAEWDAADFVDGAQTPFLDAAGHTHGFAWVAGAEIMSAARYDLIEQAGLTMPTTFEELQAVCEAVNGKDGVAAFVNDKVHHAHWIPFLMGFGGEVFKDPPTNLTPVWASPEGAASADYYAGLINRFCPSGVLSFSDEQAFRSQLAGRANMRMHELAWHTALVTHPESAVRDTVRFAHMPAGPAGSFPNSNSHGFGIPAGARNKEAAWEFIKWAMSKETTRRIALDDGYSAVCRRSVIESPAYKQQLTLNGQDVAAMYLEVLERAGRGGYMRYRFVPVYPQVGDKINKAIERIATDQQPTLAALEQAATETIADLRKAGVTVDG